MYISLNGKPEPSTVYDSTPFVASNILFSKGNFNGRTFYVTCADDPGEAITVHVAVPTRRGIIETEQPVRGFNGLLQGA